MASSLCLEITESAIMDDPPRAEAMLNRLSQQGFKLSIDDFGTGYSLRSLTCGAFRCRSSRSTNPS